MTWLPANPDALRLFIFVAVFAVMALLELRWPRRPLTVTRRVRWPVNLMIVAASTGWVSKAIPITIGDNWPSAKIIRP